MRRHPEAVVRVADRAGLNLAPDLHAPRDPDVARCDECGDVVPWVDATFLPFATLCRKDQCEVNARRKFDALPVEDDRRETA